MNTKAIVGLSVAILALLWGILLGSPLVIFYDLVSLIFVVGITSGLLVFTHGVQATGSALFGGMGRLLMPNRFAVWTSDDAKTACAIASSAIRLTMLSAVVCGLVNFIAMLQQLDHPTGDVMGPVMTSMMVSAFYGLVLIAVWFLPIARRFSSVPSSGSMTQ